jgi:hypothetical protein
MMENETLNASDFGQFLLNNHLIPADRESFFVNWVRVFFEKKNNWSDYTWT